jgi:hypothetical protein
MPTDQQHINLYLGFWAAAGPLVGIWLGNFLSKQNQHKQWARDNRKQEYRELLTSLSAAYLHIVQQGPGENEEDSIRLRNDPIRNEAFRVLHDRIFIAQEIKGADIFNKWLVVVNAYNSMGYLDLDVPDKFLLLIHELVCMALDEPS